MLENGIHGNTKLERPELLCRFVLLIQGRERKHNKNKTRQKQNNIGRIIIISSSSQPHAANWWEHGWLALAILLYTETKGKQKNILWRKF
jgi:hypothetical protein